MREVIALSFRWKLKERLALHHQLYRLTDIQSVIEEKSGVSWSLETISQLVNKTPKALRVQTVQIICNVFRCQLSDICEVLPDVNPSFTSLLNCNQHDLTTAKSAQNKQSSRRQNRYKKKPEIPEGQIDLSSLFPEAREFVDSP
jgi:DNA-binding Xre family transcriptional regulator